MECNDDNVKKVDDARRILYLHGFLTDAENERVGTRIGK
jgi:hypothetical protein